MTITSEGTAAPGEVNRPPGENMIVAEISADAGNGVTAQNTLDEVIDPGTLLILAGAVVAVFLFVKFRWYRLDRAPSRPRILSPAPAIVLVAAMMLLAVVGLTITKALLGIDRSGEEPEQVAFADHARLAAGMYIAQGIGLVVFVYLWSSTRRPAKDRRWSRTDAALAGAGALLLFWPVLAVLGWAASILVLLVRGESPAPVAHETLAMFLKSPRDGWFVLVAGLVIIVAPIIEEVIYRGLLQDALARIGLGRWGAIGLVSIVFALMHVGNTETHALLVLFVLSLGFGWMYEKTGRLTAPIVMHMAFNAGNLAVAMLFLSNGG